MKTIAITPSPTEGTWQVTKDLYARNEIDVDSLPRDRTLRKLTWNEGVKSEEGASREFQILLDKAASIN